MKRLTRPLVACLASSLVLVGALHGTDTSMAAAENPILVVGAAESKNVSEPAKSNARPVSPTIAAHLAAIVPPFQSAKSAAGSMSPAELPEEKPRNGIIRLPRYIVRQPQEKIPSLTPLQVMTPAAKTELAYKAFPGLRIGSFWIFRNDRIAREMLEEELRVERGRQAADLLSLLPSNVAREVDSANADGQRRRLIQDVLTPRSAWTEMDVPTR